MALPLSTFDIFALLWLAEGLWSGYSGGLIMELWMTLQWGVSFYAAISFGHLLNGKISGDHDQIYLIGFIGVFAITSIVFHVFMFFTRIIVPESLNTNINSITGAAVSFLKNASFLYFLFVVMIVNPNFRDNDFANEVTQGFVGSLLNQTHEVCKDNMPHLISFIKNITESTLPL
jgi:uncharacterized membrane protein required for colicin V production